MTDIQRLRHDCAVAVGLIPIGSEFDGPISEVMECIAEKRSAYRGPYYQYIAELLATFVDKQYAAKEET